MVEWKKFSKKGPSITERFSKRGPQTSSIWELARNAKSRPHPKPTDSDIPGRGAADGVLTNPPGESDAYESDTMKYRDHCTGGRLLVLGVPLLIQRGGVHQEKEWLSLFSLSVSRSAVCNMGAPWSALLVGCKLSGPEFSMGKACVSPKLPVTEWVNNPEMEYEQGFCPQIKGFTFKKKKKKLFFIRR